mgnify:CR=1 FL=1
MTDEEFKIFVEMLSRFFYIDKYGFVRAKSVENKRFLKEVKTNDVISLIRKIKNI